jgi:hypothetical protein
MKISLDCPFKGLQLQSRNFLGPHCGNNCADIQFRSNMSSKSFKLEVADHWKKCDCRIRDVLLLSNISLTSCRSAVAEVLSKLRNCDYCHKKKLRVPISDKQFVG